ncbi:hypothetical protein Salat_1110600 [Sesamum alatum]|uniref:Uncharacterized protein n=1 Tax=Sesamum alatum TaxID=300844 RepID=A0AAE1YPQ1_9LAMI|nr:hypothetical protein Salat_1110600 [Sesamum alatum]
MGLDCQVGFQGSGLEHMASLGPLNAGLAQRTSGPDNETAQFNCRAVNFRNPEFHSQTQTRGGGPCKLQQLQQKSATDGIQEQNVEHSSSSAQIPVQLCVGDRIRNQYSIPKKLDDFASHSPVSLVSTHSRTTDQNQLSGRKNFTVSSSSSPQELQGLSSQSEDRFLFAIPPSNIELPSIHCSIDDEETVMGGELGRTNSDGVAERGVEEGLVAVPIVLRAKEVTEVSLQEEEA